MGKLTLTVLGMIAEFERDLIKDRMLGGKRFRAKANSRWPGGTIAYGYAYDKGEPGEDGRWQIVQCEAEVVRRIYRMCVAEKAGASVIADTLTREGIPTPSAALASYDETAGKPFWQTLGLMWLPADKGLVLTTRAKDEAREQAERIIRRLAHQVKHNDRVDSLAKFALKLRERPAQAKQLTCPQEPPRLRFVRAKHEAVQIKLYAIIYELIDEVKRYARPPEFYPLIVVPYLPDERLAELEILLMLPASKWASA